jgi:hypothetical protein
MRATIDPQTGRFVEEPPAAVPTAPQVTAGALPAEVPLPGGGFKLDTRGRLQHNMESAVAPDGSARTGCIKGASGSGEPSGAPGTTP